MARGQKRAAQAEARIKLELEAEAFKKELKVVNESLNRANKAIAKLSTQMKRNATEQKKMSNATQRTATSMFKLQAQVSQVRNALLLWNFVMAPLIRTIQAGTAEFLKASRALSGLERVGIKMGVTSGALKTAVADLTKDGLIRMEDASKALRQTLATGIGLEKSIELLNAFKDSAAFGRQGQLSFSEAVLGGIDGFKNMNSRMTDNVGITKNLDMILKEQAKSYGKNVSALTELEKHMLIAEGLIKEASIFNGDAAAIANTTAGRFDKLDTTMAQASKSVGLFLEATGGLSLYTTIVGGLADEFIRLAGSISQTQGQAAENLQGHGLSADIADQIKLAEARLKLAKLSAGANGGSFLEEGSNLKFSASRLNASGGFSPSEALSFAHEIDDLMKDIIGANSGNIGALGAKQKSLVDIMIGRVIGQVGAGTLDPIAAETAIANITREFERLGKAMATVEATLSKAPQFPTGSPLNIEAFAFSEKEAAALTKIVNQSQGLLSKRSSPEDEKKGIRRKSEELVARMYLTIKDEAGRESFAFREMVSAIETNAGKAIDQVDGKHMAERWAMMLKRSMKHLKGQIKEAGTNRTEDSDFALPNPALVNAGPDLPDLPTDNLGIITDGANNAAKAMRNLQQAAAFSGREMGFNFAKSANLALSSISSLTTGISQVQTAMTTMSGLGQASGVLGGIALAASAIAGIGSALGIFGDSDAPSRDFNGKSTASGGGRIGGSISRGPQTVNINPTIVANAEHDIFFSDDGIDAAADNMVRAVQEAIDTGEISLDRL